jgi:hypothetical protein
MTIDLTVGIIRVLDSYSDTIGTGFVLTKDGLMATCAYVIERAGVGLGDIVCLVFHHSGDEAIATVESNRWRDPRPASRRNDRTPHPERATPLHPERTPSFFERKIRKIRYKEFYLCQ